MSERKLIGLVKGEPRQFQTRKSGRAIFDEQGFFKGCEVDEVGTAIITPNHPVYEITDPETGEKKQVVSRMML